MNYQDKSYIDSKIRNLRCTLEKKIKNIDGGGGGETPSEAAYIPLKGTETHFLQRAHLTELESALSPLAFSGDYEDLTNAPSIPAAQVQSNWNSTSGMSQILNKPTLSTVATSGSYADLTNKPTIPAAQVQPNWTASSGMGQILNKPTLTTVATSGDYNDLINKPSIPNIPSAPVTGTFILKSIEGVIQWVEEV